METSHARVLTVIREQLAAAVAARKCHGCGCLHRTVEALEGTALGREELAPVLSSTRAVFEPKAYDCLGCPVCYPAIAANAFAEAFPCAGEPLDSCPADEPAERPGWPPLPGDYRVLRYRAPVAICTLHSGPLAARIAERSPAGVAIVGTLRTENLGIERIVRNTLANPHIRHLVLCGEDARQAIGHLPGQSLSSLFEHGVDDGGRIAGARGKRPFLKNLRREQIEAFRRKIGLVPLIGEEREAVILEQVSRCVEHDPGPWEHRPADIVVPVVLANQPRRLELDPAGFFVVYADAARRTLVVEHYTAAGALDCILEGPTPSALYATVIERGLLSRLEHAAYLGRELERARRSLDGGEPYVQDRAAGGIARKSSTNASVPRDCRPACAKEESTRAASGPESARFGLPPPESPPTDRSPHRE